MDISLNIQAIEAIQKTFDFNIVKELTLKRPEV